MRVERAQSHCNDVDVITIATCSLSDHEIILRSEVYCSAGGQSMRRRAGKSTKHSDRPQCEACHFIQLGTHSSKRNGPPARGLSAKAVPPETDSPRQLPRR